MIKSIKIIFHCLELGTFLNGSYFGKTLRIQIQNSVPSEIAENSTSKNFKCVNLN